jgi:hypothetical protein
VHRLWKLVTSRGVYAVKDLRNPPGGDQWIDDYLKAWPLERACHEHGGVAMAAPLLTTDGAVLAVVPDNADGERVVRIHTWADGQNPPWTASHARLAAAIGATLARIHAVGSTIVRDEGQATSASAVPATDRWYRAIDDARDEPWAVELRATLPSILLAEELVAAAASDPGPVVMCHRDINPKNVLVGQGEPVVLDWDAAGPHPARAELACAALTWAGIEAGDPQPDALQSVVRGYRATADLAGGLTPPDIAGWAMPWLRFSEFNVARLLGQRGDLDAKEQAVARQRLDHGIRQLRRFAHHADEWGALVSGLAS